MIIFIGGTLEPTLVRLMLSAMAATEEIIVMDVTTTHAAAPDPVSIIEIAPVRCMPEIVPFRFEHLRTPKGSRHQYGPARKKSDRHKINPQKDRTNRWRSRR